MSLSAAQGVTYVVLWFDTEDYIDPIADDAALRIANDLTSLGVQGTFKVVGEKARVLERRGRTDVIQALGRHSIGYHSDWHSIEPTPSVALQHFSLLEGASEFERRQRNGFDDVSRIFGVTPVCYGQPGSSWAPQANLALRRMGVHVYLDEGTQVGYNDQPIWYGGLLYVYNVGPYQIRSNPDAPIPDTKTFLEFDNAVKHFGQTGGGLISTMYHPTEMVHTEFWDAVNFARGTVRPHDEWILPKRRSPEAAEHSFRVLKAYVEHAKATPGVKFVTAGDLLNIYATPIPPSVKKLELARHFSKGITFLSLDSGDLSAADILLQLLDIPSQYVDGPTGQGVTTYKDQTIPGFLFDASVEDARSFIRTNHYLPSEVFIGSMTLSLADFSATLAKHLLSPGDPVHVAQGQTTFVQYFSGDALGAFRCAGRTVGFSAPAGMDAEAGTLALSGASETRWWASGRPLDALTQKWLLPAGSQHEIAADLLHSW